MDNSQDIYQHLFVGIAVATVLLQTRRYGKAIELFNECLVLLKEHALKIIEKKRNAFTAFVYVRLFTLYCLVGDHLHAIQSGEKARAVYLESGDIGSAAVLQAKLLVIRGIEFQSHFDYSNAKDCFERALEIWKEIGNKREEGKTLSLLGNLFKALEEYENSKLLYERALVILEEVEDLRLEQGDALGCLGQVYTILGDYEKARSVQKRALAISVLLKDRRGEIADYRNLADAHFCLGEVEEARQCYDKALAICKETGDKNGEAMTYGELGVFHRILYNYKKAEECFRHACKLRRETSHPQHEAAMYSQLGLLCEFLGQYDEAIKCHEKAIAIRKEICDRRGEGVAFSNLGVVYMSVGDYDKAKECFERALAISTETNELRAQGVEYGQLGGVHKALGDYGKAYELHKKALELKIRTNENTEEDKESLTCQYVNLGSLCRCRGEYEKAKKFFKRALCITEQMVDRKSEAKIFAQLASLEQELGEEKHAKQYYEKALEFAETRGDLTVKLQVYNIVGGVCRSSGHFSRAMEYYEKALVISKQIGNKPIQCSCYHNVGCLISFLGDHGKANEYYEKALAISKAMGDKKGEAETNSNMATSYLLQRKYAKAEKCLKKGLSIADEIGDPKVKMAVLSHLGVLYLSRGNFEEALSYLFKCVNIIEDWRGSVGDSERYQIAFADETVRHYRLMAVMLCRVNAINLALSVSELGRARTLAELMAKQYSVKNVLGLEEIELFDFQGMGKKNSCSCLSFLSFKDSLLVWISKPSGKLVVKRIPLTGVRQDVLKDVPDRKWINSAADHTCFLFSNVLLEGCEDRSLSVLYDSHVRSPQVEISRTGCQLVEEEEKKQEEGRDECRKRSVLQLWYRNFIAPLADDLQGPEIIIVPDRSLYRVPFGALIDENDKYMADKFRIRYVPSLTVLKLILDSPENFHSQSGVLVVGDPDVGTVMFQGKQVKFSRLAFAKMEAEMIGRLLHVQPLTEKQATKETVLQKMKSVSLIHIAAHGDADRGAIALAPGHHITGTPQEKDFLLTMADISKVQLRAKLVVLSCCHSGRGHIKAEGVVGIARAFLGSGARSVLVSLWALDDDATMQFMKVFYESLACGKSASKSLHAAMKWMRGNPEYSKVSQWAPFMLIGDDVSFDFDRE